MRRPFRPPCFYFLFRRQSILVVAPFNSRAFSVRLNGDDGPPLCRYAIAHSKFVLVINYLFKIFVKVKIRVSGFDFFQDHTRYVLPTHPTVRCCPQTPAIFAAFATPPRSSMRAVILSWSSLNFPFLKVICHFVLYILQNSYIQDT